jgi:hypothetical protein
MFDMSKPVFVLIAVVGLSECDRASCSAGCLVVDRVRMSAQVVGFDV